MSKVPSKSYTDNTVRDSRISHQHFKLSNLLSGRQPTAKIKSLFKIAAVVIFLLSLLAACVPPPPPPATPTPTNTPGQSHSGRNSTPTATFMPVTSSPTPQPGNPSPTPQPSNPSPTPTPTPDPFAPNLSAIPDPAECSEDQTKGLWFCIEQLTNESNRRSLTWSASSNISGVTFNPLSGTILPNQTITVNIFLKTCTANALLSFRGPAGIVTKSITCNPTPQPLPTLTVSPSSLNQSSCASQSNGSYQCTVTLSADLDGVNWIASSDIGAAFNPSSGTAHTKGELVTITVSCKSGTFSFQGPGNTATTSWSCTLSPTPTLSVSPTSLNQGSCTSQSNGSYQCTVTLSVDQGSAQWTASSDIGATFVPQSGTVDSGGKTVTITVSCKSGTFSFQGPGNTATTSWSCIG